MTRSRQWKARWIWIPSRREIPNSYVIFRRKFRLRAQGANTKARLIITAGHFYQIYLNGYLVGHGPDRCYFREKYYHTYDVSKLMRRGRNVLAMRCHFIGRHLGPCVERQAEGPAGVLAQIDIDGRPAVWTDGRWRATNDPAYSTKTDRISMHRGWREEYNARKVVPDWCAAECDLSKWKAAEVIADAEGGPWVRLVKKTTPELTSENIAPLNAYLSQAGGDVSCDYAGNLYDLLKLNQASSSFKVWNRKQQRQELLFDFGRVLAGYPLLEIAESDGGTIEIHYGESLDLTHWDTLRLGKGPLVWSPFTSRGARYVRLVITAARRPVSIRSVQWVRTNYPVQYRGSFASSDSKLDAIWRLCALSAETCGMEHFVDCVGREQVLWMMDLRFQAPQHRSYFGDTALVEKCFRQFKMLQCQNGFIPGYGPSAPPKEEFFTRPNTPYDWLGFNFFFVIAVFEHARYTGDLRFLREFHPVCRRCLDYYSDNAVDVFAAVAQGMRGQPFVEWGYPYSNDHRAVYSYIQALYYGALTAFREIAARVGDNAGSTRAAELAAVLSKRYFKTFLDPENGRVADYVLNGKRHFAGTSQPAAAMLRYMDNIPAKALKHNLRLLTIRALPLTQTGVGNATVVEALFRHGCGNAAIDWMRDYWGAIVAADLPQTPEHYDATLPGGADDRWHPAMSRCHSYASLAGTLLQQHVLGAHVEGRRVCLSPFFGGLDYANGVVPTIAGDVRIDWKRAGRTVKLHVKAPRGVEVDLQPVEKSVAVSLTVTNR